MNIHFYFGAAMVRPTTDQTLLKIRKALVEEVAEKGIAATSVGAVAKRAGVATGTIYLHFANKDEMLQQIYLQIKTEFHAIMVAATAEPDSTRMIRRMWFDMFDFVAAHPFDFMFVEYAGAAQVLTTAQLTSLKYMQPEIAAMLQRAVDDGTLAELPVATITTLLVAPALHMARNHALQKTAITQELIALTFERVWLSVAAPAQRPQS